MLQRGKNGNTAWSASSSKSKQPHDEPSDGLPAAKHYFSPMRWYVVETICAPCGTVIGWRKFPKSEGPAEIIDFLEDFYPDSASRPSYVCMDKGCLLVKYLRGSSGKWDDWEQTTQFVVDTYHYKNHKTTDHLCQTLCNPTPNPNIAPNLVKLVDLPDGTTASHVAFNTQVCEHLNAWIAGFEPILKRQGSRNFNWFLHSMLFLHTSFIIQKRREEDGGN